MKQKRPIPSTILTFQEQGASSKGQLLAPRESGTPARCFSVAPNEEARCMLGAKKKGARQGWLQNVITPGTGRCESVCPHYGFCGGCAYQHLNYEAQLKIKSQPIENLIRACDPDAEILPVQPAPSPWYYRSKVEFSFIKDRLGFNIRGLFQKVTDITECFIGPPCNRKVLEIVRSWQKKHSFSGWDPYANAGFLRYLVIRHSFSTGEFLTAIVTSTPDFFDPHDQNNPMHELAESLIKAGAAGVIWALNDSISPVAAGQSEILLAGKDSITEKVNRLELSLGWKSFFQSNPPAYAHMLRTAAELVGPQEKILDLYCGVGSIGLSLPGYVTGVEIIEQAVEHAKANAQILGREAEFYCGNSEDWPEINNCSLLVIDPPRSGCSPKLIKRLPEEGPDNILYISCNPMRFIEEYASLKPYYSIKKAQMYDFFPHTPHIETLFILSRKKTAETEALLQTEK